MAYSNEGTASNTFFFAACFTLSHDLRRQNAETQKDGGDTGKTQRKWAVAEGKGKPSEHVGVGRR